MGYTKYDFRVVKLDKMPYYPRANKPMVTLVKPEWDKALMVSRMWHSERMRAAYFRDDSVAKQVRPTIIMEKSTRGARFATAQEFEGVQYGDNESDLAALKREAKRRYKSNTLENTSNRVRMMLSMLGDVQVIEKGDLPYNQRSGLRYDGNWKLFTVKDCKLILFEPEMEDA